MKTLRNWALAGVLLAVGCSSGSSATLEQIQQALQGCTQTSVLDLLRLFIVLADAADVASGGTSDGVAVVPSTDVTDPANTFDVTSTFAALGNGPDDTTFTGKVTFGADPTDGIEDGDTFTLAGVVTSNGGPLSGTLDIQGTIGQSVLTGDTGPPVAEEVFALTGTINLTNSLDNCVIAATIETPFVVDFEAGSRTQARILGIEMFGSFQLALTALGNTLTSTINIPVGAQTAQIDGQLLGQDFDFFSDLFPPEAEVIAAADCFQLHTSLVDAVQDALNELPDAVLNPKIHPDVMITQGSALGQFDYVVTRDNLMVSGEAFIPVTGFGTGTFTFNLTGGMLVGLNLPPVTGMNINGPLTFTLVEGAVESFYGAMEFMTTGDGCKTTVTIPESDPATADFDDGTINIVVVLGDVTLAFVIDLGANDGNEGFVSATVNGLPVPAEALLGFFFNQDR